MGMYGCMNFAYANGLVKSQISGTIACGAGTPIAVDLWNVMYGLLEKFYPEKIDGVEDSIITLRCLYCLLRLLHQRSYYPVFVSDRGMYGNVKALYGAKAIAATCNVVVRGSGRLRAIVHDEDEETEGGSSRKKRPHKRICRWSDKSDTPKIIHRLCMRMIRFMGYPYVDAGTMEADDICANLYHTKTVAYVLSSDTDLILMGCDIIIDLTRIFPPTIHCKDILAALKMDYSTFLLNFLRCHTDLHREPNLKSMQEIVELGSAMRGMGNAIDDHDSADSTIHAVNEKHIDRSGLKHNLRTTLSENRKNDHNSSTDRLCATYNDVNIIRDARQALTHLRAPRTKCEVLEYKFIKHVIENITPERRTHRVSILKRFPITQETRDDSAIENLVLRSIVDSNEAGSLASAFLRRIPEIPPFNRVLTKYWNRVA
uniref:Virion host shutoff protein n=1 Tax=Gallid alphaherpesvirus 2 TaxID=10390 RepID=Q69280_9ALPH|nr:virion host shutoff protein [Gallid alphaherpesvirus 2]